MTILEALRWANNQLKTYSIDSPMLDAEVLLSHVLNLTRAKLFANFNSALKPNQSEEFFSLVERRGKHEPVAYLIGKKSFFGRDFFVNPFVLIPRPETELMIQTALDLLSQEKDTDRILLADIGTGSGAIAVTLAAQTQMPVIAVDTNQRILSVAKENAKRHGVSQWIDWQVGDLLVPIFSLFNTIRVASQKPISSVYPFKHLIICANLPYLSTHQITSLPLDVRAYEPTEALVAGADGLDAYFQLFRQLKKQRDLLPRRVDVLIEIDPSQTKSALALIAHSFPLATIETKKDLIGLDRLVTMTHHLASE